ncbi:MAG: glycosyltransferase family 4 protein [Acidobacteria bacterium]|nr:glycosyltransferase family 4 protein [Acidobacteriota bacterium]
MALLTNFIPPYREPVIRWLLSDLGHLTVFVSTPMELDRSWGPQDVELPVSLQRTITIRRPWRHPHGFTQHVYVHLPYDTVWRLLRFRPNVIVSAELGLRTAQAVTYRKLRPTCRLVLWATLSEHTEDGRGKLRNELRRWLLPQADAVLVNGESGARYVRRYGVREECIFRVPQAVDVSKFACEKSAKERAGPLRLLCVGQLIERKGLVPWFRTLKQWLERNRRARLECWLVGDGPLRGELERFPFPPNLTTRFPGNVPYSELPQYYTQSDVLAFPTLADEWGLVVNEALASGVPVLGSLYSQAVEELVRDGHNGWTFRPDNPEEMFVALDRALNTPTDHLNEMRVAARRSVEHLTPKYMAGRILEAVRFVCRS